MTIRILLDVPGSTAEQRETGVRHALGILAAGGVTCDEARLAHHAHEAWHAAGRPPGEITVRERETAAVFRLARLAAIEACEGEALLASEDCRFEILPPVLH